MITKRGVFFILLILASGVVEETARADDSGKVKVITDWTEDEQPIRVDCENLGISGTGFGGSQLSCMERLSLYATFSCFPAKKEDVEAKCPEWEGLKADIDWERVAELIDARVDEEEKTTRELVPDSLELKEHLDDDH